MCSKNLILLNNLLEARCWGLFQPSGTHNLDSVIVPYLNACPYYSHSQCYITLEMGMLIEMSTSRLQMADQNLKERRKTFTGAMSIHLNGLEYWKLHCEQKIYVQALTSFPRPAQLLLYLPSKEVRMSYSTPV